MGLFGYIYATRSWKQLRAHQLRVQPLCVLCGEHGWRTPATVVDHIRPHKGDPALAYDPGNLQSLCKLCHDGVKQRADNRGGVLPGADAAGLPLHPGHPWAATTPSGRPR